MSELIKSERINVENLIYEVKGLQVMLSSEVAKLYQVDTKALNQTIKRNIKRFPISFCFQLDKHDINQLPLRSQFVTLNKNNNMRGQHYKYYPYALTEQGIMMLSGLLKSDIAVNVNIQIIDAFVKMRQYMSSNLIEQRYINNMVLKHDESINFLMNSFEKKESNEIYYKGQMYDSYSKILEIFNSSKKELIIIDSYADNTILDIIKRLSVDVTIITKKDNLLTNQDIRKYSEQYSNLKVIFNNTFHDRYFIIDETEVYHCGTSINRIGHKTFSINLLNDANVCNSFIKNVKMIIDNKY